MDEINNITEKIKGYPQNLERLKTQEEFLEFGSTLMKYFGGVKSMGIDMLGDSEKYGSNMSLPAEDENKRPMIVICNNLRSRDCSRENPKIILFAYSNEKIFRYKDIIDFSLEHSSYWKLQALILSAKKFMEGEMEEDKFIVIKDANSKEIFESTDIKL